MATLVRFLASLVFVILCFTPPRLMAGSVAATDPNKLPGPPVGPNDDDLKNFREHAFVVTDAAGKSLKDMPATLIDIISGMGDWASVSEDKAPKLKFAIPADLQDKVQLFAGPTDLDWMVVPRGWKVWRAALGADGNSWFTFVSPKGPEDGWMITGEIPGCFGCMYWDADGLIPGAHEQLISGGLADEGTKTAEVIPTPESMSRPNECTAVFRYKMPKSPPVRAVFYLGPYQKGGDTVEESLYLALPPGSSKVADFIVSSFQKQIGHCE